MYVTYSETARRFYYIVWIGPYCNSHMANKKNQYDNINTHPYPEVRGGRVGYNMHQRKATAK